MQTFYQHAVCLHIGNARQQYSSFLLKGQGFATAISRVLPASDKSFGDEPVDYVDESGWRNAHQTADVGHGLDSLSEPTQYPMLDSGNSHLVISKPVLQIAPGNFG